MFRGRLVSQTAENLRAGRTKAAAEDNHRPGMYEPDPAVLKQLGELEAGGRFMAEWDGGRWKIGRRLLD